MRWSQAFLWLVIFPYPGQCPLKVISNCRLGGVVRLSNGKEGKAVENGKLFTLDVRAGRNGTPDWIFNTYTDPAGPGPVAPLTFKDWGSDRSPPANSCGSILTIGSPVDTAYRGLYTAMIQELAAHVASDSRWFQALAHVKISGANFISSEARLPKRCYDEDGNGILDTVIKSNGQPDFCLCNSKIWADAGYTPIPPNAR